MHNLIYILTFRTQKVCSFLDKKRSFSLLPDRNFIFRGYELRMVVANLTDSGYGYVAKMKEWEESVVDRNNQDLVYDPVAMLVVAIEAMWYLFSEILDLLLIYDAFGNVE